jgi:hypothetical protein
VSIAELQEEIALELDGLEATVSELTALQRDLADREPSVRERAAAAAFLAQFYNGIENILKRISYHHGVPLPIGDTWHSDLFQRFCSPPYPELPLLFDEAPAGELAPCRRFRRVAFHSYGFQLDWGRMAEGVASAGSVFQRIKLAQAADLDAVGA